MRASTYIGAKNTKNEMTLPMHHKQKKLIILLKLEQVFKG